MTTIPVNAANAPLLTIDLNAILHNYQLLAQKCPTAQTAAVVKANSYGTGMDKVAPMLYQAGCNTFFVATLTEAKQLRNLLTDCEIYIFNGLPQGAAQDLIHLGLRPVLGQFAELEEWANACQKDGKSHPAALHYDTAMNRLGFIPSELQQLQNHTAFKVFSPTLVISHLACGDSPNHPLNQKQLQAFSTFRKLFPKAKASLANSAGIFLGSDYHFDLVRPGIALYGGCPSEDLTSNPMAQVATVKAEIIRIKTVAAGENIGYGGIETTSKETVVATLNSGYADGYNRMLGVTQNHNGALVFIKGQSFPLLGRVSMDLLTVDITNSQTLIQRGDLAEIIGSNITIDDLAAQAQTISYEILTNLGNRYHRIYQPVKGLS